MKVELGKKAKDTITGFSGIVTGRCEYITGCTQILVQPVVKPDGEFVESRWVDEDRLTVTDEKPISLKVTNPGADREAPRR